MRRNNLLLAFQKGKVIEGRKRNGSGQKNKTPV